MRHALDTNVWRYMLRDARYAQTIDAMMLDPLGLTTVVAAELIRGATTPEMEDRVERILERWAHTLSAPEEHDWIAAAHALRRVRHQFGYDPTGVARLQNDALIAVTCARLGWIVVTTNRVDFERLAATLGRRRPRIKFVEPPR